MRTPRNVVALALASLLWTACAAGGPVADLSPGQRPALDTDEAGLWMQMDRIEADLRTSGRVVRDPALNAHVRDIVCRLAPEHCRFVRVYVVQAADFNASMAPNGAMSVWTGLLLRVENDAQLAHLLGHELAHYLRRHSVQRWRALSASTDAATAFSMVTAVAGVGFAGVAAQLATLDGILAFSRDQEREADLIGFEMMVDAGYDPHQAAAVWRALIAELEVAEEGAQPIFFASHPAAEERLEALEALADAMPAPQGRASHDRHDAVTEPYRAAWLRDELRQRDFARAQVLLRRLIDRGGDLGDLYYFEGELYRLRGDDGDEANAADAYEVALETGTAPPETYRSLGLVYWSVGRLDDARLAFEDYLRARPDADDRLMVETYLQQF